MAGVLEVGASEDAGCGASPRDSMDGAARLDQKRTLDSLPGNRMICTFKTMLGLRISSMASGKEGTSRLRFLDDESDDRRALQGLLLLKFNVVSDAGVRMPDFGRDASEFRQAWEDILSMKSK
jgi:hypothetical protein